MALRIGSLVTATCRQHRTPLVAPAVASAAHGPGQRGPPSLNPCSETIPTDARGRYGWHLNSAARKGVRVRISAPAPSRYPASAGNVRGPMTEFVRDRLTRPSALPMWPSGSSRSAPSTTTPTMPPGVRASTTSARPQVSRARPAPPDDTRGKPWRPRPPRRRFRDADGFHLHGVGPDQDRATAIGGAQTDRLSGPVTTLTFGPGSGRPTHPSTWCSTAPSAIGSIRLGRSSAWITPSDPTR